MRNLLILITAAALFTGCSGDKKKTTAEKKPETEVTDTKKDETKKDNVSNMTISGDLGEIDQAMVQKKFDESKDEVQKCITDGIGSDTYVGGNMDFTFRINLDGTVKKLDFSSTVGHRGIEKCVYNFAHKLKFVKPKGGEGKVAYPFAFDPAREIKKTWNEDNLGKAWTTIRKAMMKCSDGTDNAPSTFTVVFYVLPDAEIGYSGVSSGKKLVSDKFYNCVKASLKKAKLPDPLGTVAKVTVSIQP